jgi:aryl-alcohol dehydrogenase-like predicted oxidoreductase
VRAFDDVVRQGKVRYIGLSNYMSWQAATAVMLQERRRPTHSSGSPALRKPS